MRTRNQGFTIVELIVVIIVIGILAAIAIIGYGAWRKTITGNTIQSDLRSVVSAYTSSGNFSSSSSSYPATIPAGVQASPNVQLSGGGRPGGKTFCVSGVSTTDPTIVYYVSDKQKTPTAGNCTLQSAVVIPGSATASVWGVQTALGRSQGAVVGSDGTVYLASGGTNNILMLAPGSSSLTSFSGSGVSGSADGAATVAQYKGPNGIVQDSSGNFYVTDVNNNSVRKVSPNGSVVTFAGVYQPNGLAIDGSGNLYVSSGDSGRCQAIVTSGQRIVKVSAAGVVTTMAGTGLCGMVDGVASSAQFNIPTTITVDPMGNVYVVDSNSNCHIRKLDTTGMVSTIGSLTTCAGSSIDGPVASAGFRGVGGLASDKSGNIWFLDGSQLRVLSTDGKVTTVPYSGPALNASMALVYDPQNNFYVTNLSGDILKVTIP